MGQLPSVPNIVKPSVGNSRKLTLRRLIADNGISRCVSLCVFVQLRSRSDPGVQ